MNTFQTRRREQIESVLAEPDLPLGLRVDAIAHFVEREVREAFQRGLREAGRAAQRKMAGVLRRQLPQSALAAGKLQPVVRR